MTQVKLFDPFPRLTGTTLADFSAHWTGVHAEIAKHIPQIRHYVQSHRIDNPPHELFGELGATWCDGSSETWYDSAQSIQAMMDEPALAELMLDEANFMDLKVKRYPVMTCEHLIDAGRFEPERHGIKILLFVRRPKGVSPEEFHTRWLTDEDVALGRALGATRHVACPAVAETYTFLHPNPDVRDGGEQPYDGVRELWWPSLDALTRAARDQPDAWSALLWPSAADVPRSLMLVAHERVIIS
jgi:uncharacterized protein (TIGR02118 family)